MRKKEGFTLIEIAIVIFLLGLFFLIAIPKFNDLTDVKIKSTSRRLGGTIKQLYNEAAFKNKIYKLIFDIDNGEYWIEVQKGEEFVLSNDPAHKRTKLPNGIFFKDIKTDRIRLNTLDDREDFILFLPTGFVEPALIYLETENGTNYTLATKPYTGGTKVFDEYVEEVHY